MLSWAHRYKIDYSEYSAAQRVIVAIMSHVGKLFKQSSIEKRFTKIAMNDNGKGYDKLFSAYYPAAIWSFRLRIRGLRSIMK